MGALLADRYEIRGFLGAGGYAYVSRAYDRELRQEVALKQLRPDRVTDTTLARLRREAAIAREAQSPRLLRVFEIESAGEAAFLAVELVGGGSLRERLRSGEALAEARAAVEAARRTSEPLLVEACQRFEAKALVAAGELPEAEALFARLAVSSEAAAEIAFDAAEASHLHGHLDRAVRWYERGMGRGGQSRPGKSKYDLLEGMVFALGEQERWQEALEAVDRYQSAYGDPGSRALSTVVREWVRWRAGEVPSRVIEPGSSWPDVPRYLRPGGAPRAA